MINEIMNALGIVGNSAKGIREAIAGKEIITSQERLKILEQVNSIEIALLQAESNGNLQQNETNKIDFSRTKI